MGIYRGQATRVHLGTPPRTRATERAGPLRRLLRLGVLFTLVSIGVCSFSGPSDSRSECVRGRTVPNQPRADVVDEPSGTRYCDVLVILAGACHSCHVVTVTRGRSG